MWIQFLSSKLIIFVGLHTFLAVVVDGQQPKVESTTENNEVFVTSSCFEKPFRCPHPKIEFYLYTRRSQKNPEKLNVLDEEAFYYTRFNKAHPTKIIIHGFGGGRNLSPSTDLRNAYFQHGDYNIIIVDYGNAVKEPCLSQMEWAPRFGALCIAQLVKYISLHPRGVPPDVIHFIGYSVGAHIAGLVANHFKPEEGKLGRITGLDPTIFFYSASNNTRDLDKSDAHFVDVIHTGAGILGQWSPSGHADFYVNGGTSQPGCASTTLFQTLACDHTKVTPYFIESINTKKGFYAYPCTNLFSYLIGWCEPKKSEYVLMGEHCSYKARGIYYLSTNGSPPYAKGVNGARRNKRNNGSNNISNNINNNINITTELV